MKETITTDYSDIKSWGLYGYTAAKNPPADIFYVHPTTYIFDDYMNGTVKDIDALWELAENDRSPANASLSDEKVNHYTDNVCMSVQGALYGQVGRVFAPRYQQTHMRFFYLGFHQPELLAANAIAIADITAAFLHYMAHENQGRPFFLIGHSQGSNMLLHLMQTLFDDPKATYLKSLIAAYLPGFPVNPEDFQHIPFMVEPTEAGGYLSWNCFKEGGYPEHYVDYVKKKGQGINPMTFTQNPEPVIKAHPFKKKVPLSFRYDPSSGLVMVSAIGGEEPKRFQGIYNLHPYDVSFFKEEIVENMQLRIQNYQNKG